jgi:hypothetical protein
MGGASLVSAASSTLSIKAGGTVTITPAKIQLLLRSLLRLSLWLPLRALLLSLVALAVKFVL